MFGSKPTRSSPNLIAACHVLHRLSVPRHPPNALVMLDPYQKSDHMNLKLPQRCNNSKFDQRCGADTFGSNHLRGDCWSYGRYHRPEPNHNKLLTLFCLRFPKPRPRQTKVKLRKQNAFNPTNIIASHDNISRLQIIFTMSKNIRRTPKSGAETFYLHPETF